VEALRIAWPGVKSPDKVFPWAITEFAEKGVSHEIYDYLEPTAAPDPADSVLLDRIHFFIEAGELVRQKLDTYFVRRNEGGLDPLL
jgi:hypothetical protein